MRFPFRMYMVVLYVHYLFFLIHIRNHVLGTLEGYSFDSDDDADKVPKTVTNQTDQNEDGGEQSNTKPKSKKAEKASVCFLTLLFIRAFLIE